jgi:hypothetical protein
MCKKKKTWFLQNSMRYFKTFAIIYWLSVHIMKEVQ